MSASTFLDELAVELGTDRAVLSLESRLIEDLGLDSLAAVALLIWLEDLTGAFAPEVDRLPTPDVAAVYALYRWLCTAPRT